ncbi:hypothetical protein DEO72_LG7g2917 [Vigna unguiculata]|uniref:Non-specific lipid-transfer protein n=1 Tax=Vigna unguiculata TaxID=3917 RepID=A0A4D6MKT9_VIGUN|nr:hypothetical protein DEO72_LG7g2917 [Vigna unguiculata]
MKTGFVSFFTIVAVLVVTVVATEALTCEQEQSLVAPCLEFVTKKTIAPSPLCCQGLNKIITSTPTKEEKQAACKCLKEAASHIPNLDKDRANNLPKDCKLNGFDCDL